MACPGKTADRSTDRPGAMGADRIVTESATYYAKFRDAGGTVVTRSTGCRDRKAAEQLLARWEREVEQVRAGVLDPKDLTSARRSSAPLADMLSAYDRSLAASEVSDTYRANVLRAVRRLARECRFASLADLDREAVEDWLATRAGEGMSARSRNYYRNSLVVFANWCRDSGRIREHDLDRLPRADERADPRRQRRALTADELTRLLAVAAERPLIEARTVRRGARKGEAYGDVRPEVADRLSPARPGAGPDLQDARPDRAPGERVADPDGRPARPDARGRMPPPGSQEREEPDPGRSCRSGPTWRATCGAGLPTWSDWPRPTVHSFRRTATDPRPRPAGGGHSQAGRPGSDDRRSRHADDVRDALVGDRDGPANGPGGDAAFGHQADDGRVHRPPTARRSWGDRPTPDVDRCRIRLHHRLHQRRTARGQFVASPGKSVPANDCASGSARNRRKWLWCQ